jgi:RNA polymerase sigma-70 factor, ECF subfamily
VGAGSGVADLEKKMRGPARRADASRWKSCHTLRAVETDAELCTRLRDGDEEAFVMLVSRYQQPMTRLARSIVSSPSVAEEAVQDTWMGVVRGIDRFEGRSSLKTWLFRILVNRARSAGSQEPANAPIEALHNVDPSRFDARGQWAEPVEQWAEEAEDRLEAAKWSPILSSALADLPARQRQVVILRDVEGLSSEEACAVLGITAGNLRILLHRGRSRLRETLEAKMAKD